MKKSCLYAIILIMGIGVCGCGMKQDNMETSENVTNASTELNERQRNILEEQGLSTNADELTYSQLKAIEAIEEMLTYLDDKYDMDFAYVGYTAAGNLEKETLRAVVVDKDPLIDSFDVIKTENGYADDYMNIALRDDFSGYVEELLGTECGFESIKVFADIIDTKLSKIPEDKSDYNGNVGSCNNVYVYVDENQDFDLYVQNIEEVMKRHNLSSTNRVSFMKENILNELTIYNYTDYLSNDYYWDSPMFSVH